MKKLGNIANFYKHIHTIANELNKIHGPMTTIDFFPEHPRFDGIYEIEKMHKGIHDAMWKEYMNTYTKWVYI